MSLVLPDPDEIRHVPTGTIPLWICPHCALLHPLEGYGLRCLNGTAVRREAAPPRYIKQSWCFRCRMLKWDSPSVPAAQPYLIGWDQAEVIATTASDDPGVDVDDWTAFFEGIQ